MHCSTDKKGSPCELLRLVTPCSGIAAASLAVAAAVELNLPLGPWGTVRLPDNSTIPREWVSCRDHPAALVRHKDSYAYVMTHHQLSPNRSEQWWRAPINFVTRKTTPLTNEVGETCDLVAFPVYNFGWQGGLSFSDTRSVDCWLIEKNASMAMTLAITDYSGQLRKLHGNNTRQASLGSYAETNNLRRGSSGSPVITQGVPELFGVLKSTAIVKSFGRHYLDLTVVSCTSPTLQQQVKVQADQGLATAIINRLVLRFERVACIWGGVLAVVTGAWWRMSRKIRSGSPQVREADNFQ